MKVDCKYKTYCGGCLAIDKPIENELSEKIQYIRELFSHYKDARIDDCKGDYYPYKYRNKIHLAFGELKGKTIIGFFEEGSTKIVDVKSCMLFGDWATKLIEILREYISRFKIRPYTRNGSGVIRYAHARCISDRLQLTLVVTTDNFAGRDWLYNKLKENYADVSFYLNINKRTDRAVFDKTFKFVKGSKYLTFKMCGVDVSLSPSSFLQVNMSIAEKMYKRACEMLDITENTIVVDLYSGIGITSILFARKAQKVISIEEISSAVENARFMAKLNNVKNISHMLGKCENEISKLDSTQDLVVFVDPARVGLDRKVIEALKKLNPRKIVYMSCNPETCVRDIDILTKSSEYKLNLLESFNMFPFTSSIELLACIEK